MQNTATTGRAVAGAAIGGVALGGAGMIAGALVGGKKSEALVTFYFKNGNSALGKCNAPMLEALQVLIFEGKIREGNPHAILPTEHNQGASESESVGDKGSAAIPAPPKKKGGISKKIFMFAVIVLLCVIIDKFGGGPVGLTTIATALGEEPDTLEEVYEPFLIKEGFMKRTPRGREVTELAYRHLGRLPLTRGRGLFDDEE